MVDASPQSTWCEVVWGASAVVVVDATVPDVVMLDGTEDATGENALDGVSERTAVARHWKKFIRKVKIPTTMLTIVAITSITACPFNAPWVIRKNSDRYSNATMVIAVMTVTIRSARKNFLAGENF